MASFKLAVAVVAASGMLCSVVAQASHFSVPDCNGITNAAQRLSCIASDKAIAASQLGLDTTLHHISMVSSSKKTEVRKLGVPNVASTYGIGDDLTAVLAWDNGNSLTVKKGYVLPDGWRVTQIETGLVTITKNGQHHILLMQGAGSSSKTPKSGSFSHTFSPISPMPQVIGQPTTTQ